MDGIKNWIEAEGTGHYFFLAVPIAFLCLFAWFKGRRIRLLIPCLILAIVVINPWFYNVWDRLGLYAYWRVLWIVPVIPMLGCIVPSICEKTEDQKLKILTIVVGVSLFAFGGTYIYSSHGGMFVRATNAEKLPGYIVQISDRILQYKDKGNPRIVAQDPLGIYIRQYTGEIDTCFGRNLSGFILSANKETINLHNQLISGDTELTSRYMLDEGYEYLVYNREVSKEFSLLDSVNGYGIYAVHGNPSVVKERNDIGQIVAITTLDETGNPIDGEEGFSTVHRNYDYYNNIVREWRTDINNHIVNYTAGHCLIDQDWDNYGNLVERRYLDYDGQIINRKDGYSKAVWEIVDGTKSVHFYDIENKEISLEGLNLAQNADSSYDKISDWMTPEPNKKNICFSVGSANLGDKACGDSYTCQIEIEFRGVIGNKDFLFATQGPVDDAWKVSNIWNGGLIWLNEAPLDGCYSFSYTCQIDSEMALASKFDLGFRCDNWKSGSFRVKRIKVEKGNNATKWSPGV